MADVESSIVGQPSTGGLGTAVSAFTLPLRSRKTTSSTVTWALSGKFATGSQGSVTPSRSKPLTTSASTLGSGFLTAVITTTEPVVADSIVDEVSSETEVKTHADVLWYPRWDSNANIGADWTYRSPNYPALGGVTGTTNSEFITWADYGIEALRVIGTKIGDPVDVSPSTMEFRVWINSASRTLYAGGNVPLSSGGNTGIVSTPQTELYFRQCVMMEDLTGFANPAGKLSGMHVWPSGLEVDITSTYQYQSPTHSTSLVPTYGSPQQIETYWTNATQNWQTRDLLGLAETGLPPKQPPRFVIGKIHSIETHIKLPTRTGTPGNYSFAADGMLQTWFDDVLVVDRRNIQISRLAVDVYEIEWIQGQLFTGGALHSTGNLKFQVGGFALSTRKIGKLKRLTPGLFQNINSGSWTNASPFTGGWTQTGANSEAQIDDMEFAVGYTHTSGKGLEFSTSNDLREPGNNTGVRLVDFWSQELPTHTYAWPNNDTLIYEADNKSSFYLSWKQWVFLQHYKIINIGGTPATAVKRWPSALACAAAQDSATVLDMSDVVDYVIGAGVTAPSPHTTTYTWYGSANPCCDLNPPTTTTFTFNYGGGYDNSFPNGFQTLARIVDDNPNYPATSTKPLRMRVVTANVPSPTHMHGGVRIGDYWYWGGTNIHNNGDGTHLPNDDLHKFYRLYLPDLQNGTITQEAITNCPIQASSVFGTSAFAGGWKYGLLCADTTRRKLILINGQGVFVYTVPSDHGNDGTWAGPYTFGMTTQGWCNTMSGGLGNLTGNFAGFIGTHRSDMNKTFFRYNKSKAWNRIDWP